jgi:hypothetical protein
MDSIAHKWNDKDDTRVRESCMSALVGIVAIQSTSYFKKGIKEKKEAIRLEALRGLSKWWIATDFFDLLEKESL